MDNYLGSTKYAGYLEAGYFSAPYVRHNNGIEPNQLLDLDFTDPKQQEFPLTAAALAALMGGGLVGGDIEEIWDFTEASGNFVGEVASTALVPVGSDLVQDTECVGLFDGTDLYSHKGVRFDVDGVTTNRAQDAGTTIGNFTTDEKLGVLVMFRIPHVPPTTRAIILNRSPNGWSIRVNATGGLMVIVDGDTIQGVTIAQNHCDGAWHYALATMDAASGSTSLNIFSDLGDGTPNTTDFGDPVSTQGIAVGGIPAVENHGIMQIKYGAVLRGKTMTSAMGASFWTHGGQNFGTPAELDTYTRASLCTTVVGNESGFGERVAKWSGIPTVPQFAHGWSSLFSHASKLSAQLEPTGINLCLQSEDQSTTWAQTNVTVTANDAEAPDGNKTADKLVATADNGYSKSGDMVTVATTKYVGSIRIKRVGGSDVSGRLIQYDETGSSEDGAVVYTATDEWQRIQIAPTVAGSILTSLRIEIDTNGDGVYVSDAQFEAHLRHATSYIPTTTASATRAATDTRVNNTGGNTYYKSVAGEVQFVGIPDNIISVNNRALWGIQHPVSDNDRNFTNLYTNGNPLHRIYDNVGAIKHSFIGTKPGNWASQENTVRLRHDSQKSLPGRSETCDSIINGARVGGAGGAVTWTAGNGATLILVGTATSPGYELQGLCASLKIWDGPRAE